MWKTLTLEEACELVTDGSHNSPKDFLGGLPMASVKDMTREGITVESCRTISKEDFLLLVKNGCQPQHGDVLIAKDGAKCLDTVCIYRQKDEIVLLSSIAILRPGSDLDSGFLRYYLEAPDTLAMLKSGYVSGSAIPRVVLKDFRRAPITLPHLAEQRAIAGILGALDDKIELNRHMNRTLESMARAVFRQWFVENDEIENWEEKPLYEFAEYINGAAYKDFDFSSDNSGLPIIKIAEIKNGITDQTKFTNKQMEEKYRIGDGDILFAWSGSPDTSIDTSIWVDGEGWLNQHIFKVVPPDPSRKWFTYLLLKHFKEIFIEIARDKQTTGLGHVTVKDLQRLMFAYPPENVLASVSGIVDPMMERLFANEKESRTLASLRDSLLPKLMRGEVRVKL